MLLISGSVPIEWAGEHWVLLPQRALWWPRAQALVLADMHLGKAAAFRAGGVPVPEVIQADLDLLDQLIRETSARSIMIVGDLIHAAAGRTPAVLDTFTRWREPRKELEITLVRGNHDDRAGDPPGSWGIGVHDGPWRARADSAVTLDHDPTGESGTETFVIGGHLHPAVALADDCGRGVRAACFWVRPRSLVLPAFGRFTGMRAIRPCRGDRVFAIGPGEVTEAVLGLPSAVPAVRA